MSFFDNIAHPYPASTAIGHVCFTSYKFRNCNICILFKKDLVSVPYVVPCYKNLISGLNWKEDYSSGLSINILLLNLTKKFILVAHFLNSVLKT